MRKTAHLLVAALIVTWTAAGCTKKSENPLSPTVAGPIGGVSITAPKLLEPQHQQTLSAGTAVTLLFESATSTGERPITQELQVALDPEFSQRVHSAARIAVDQDRFVEQAPRKQLASLDFSAPRSHVPCVLEECHDCRSLTAQG